MIKIIESDLEGLKNEMKQKTANIKEVIRSLKRIPEKGKSLSVETQKKIALLDNQLNMYSVSKVLPVRVGQIVINYALYKKMLPKWKGFDVSLRLTGDRLLVEYKNNGSTNGVFTLLDMSQYFKDFKHIPVAELINGQQT